MKLCQICGCVTHFNDVAHVEPSTDVCPPCVIACETYEQRQAKLSAAFDRVKNAKHWKNPINKILALTPEERNVIEDAVIHFAGCVPTFIKMADGRTRVVAVGYYNAVGA